MLMGCIDMSKKTQVKEFIVRTNYKPGLGYLYHIGKDGNLCETTMGPKSKGYKAPIVAKLNIQKEDGWLYVPRENPEFIRNRDGTIEVPKNCVIEVWRYKHSIRKRNN